MEAWERLFMMVAIQAGRFFKLWATTMPRLCPLRPARAVSPIHPARGISFPGKATRVGPSTLPGRKEIVVSVLGTELAVARRAQEATKKLCV